MTFTIEQLENIQAKHLRWLCDQDNGSQANLSYADLSSANLSYAKGVATDAECIARLDEIRQHVIEHGDCLAMNIWHGNGWDATVPPEHACQTSHCLAGWAQALCPDLEMRKLDPVTAGVRLIPLAGTHEKPCPATGQKAWPGSTGTMSA